MAFARDVYTATPSQTDFTITFSYQEEEDVLVYQNGTLLTVTTDYTFFTATTIRLVTGATSGDTIILQRATSQDARRVTWVAGGLTSDDMNNADEQLFFMTQEAIDTAATALGLGTDQNWDATSLLIKNVTDPTAAQDAATKNYVDGVALGSFPSPLAVGSGGTGATTAAAARTALGLVIDTDVQSHVMTTQGDMIRGGASGAPERFAIGTAGQFLQSDGTDAGWTTLAWDDLPDGSVVQVVNTMDGAVATGTTTVPADDTIPQNTEGDEYMTLSITPKATTNILLIEVVFNGSTNVANTMVVSLFQDSTASALAAMSESNAGAVSMPMSFVHKMTAGTTSATTFKVRCGPVAAGTVTFNGASSGRLFGGVMASSITITEIKAS